MTTTHPRTFLALALTLGAIACTSHRPGYSDAATGGTGGSSGPERHIAHYDADRTNVGMGQNWSGKNHHFSPRPHQAHYAPRVASPPPLGSLPHFVDGSARCFPQPATHYPPYYPHPRPVPPPYQLHGGAGTGSGYGTGRAMKSSAAPRATSKPEGRAAESAVSAPSTPRDSAQGSAGQGALRGGPPRKSGRGRAERDNAHDDSGYAPFDPNQPSEYQPESAFGAAIYLSNDDTMSLSSAQRLIFAIDQYAPLNPEQIRPHELLNYFSFDTAPVRADHDFSVVASAAPHPESPGLVSLGIAVQGRPLTLSTRRNANLSFVVDRSGSMSAEGRMEYVKRGMLRSLSELKTGDIVNITLFDSSTCQLAENFVVGRDSMSQLTHLIGRVQPTGSTNLHDGLTEGYRAADRSYRPEYTNRVIMITDAEANTGITDEELISVVGKHYDARRIRLSGIGVGRTFNDSLLDRLTERGRGAYVFLGSDAEVDAVFGSRFVSLIETVASDVHFKLHLPPSLKMDTFHGEEASTEKERVQSIHYFANTSQMFLSDLTSRDGRFPGTDDVMLTIEYQDAESGQARVEEFAWNLGDITSDRRNIDKAHLVSTFARRLKQLALRPIPSQHGHSAHSWIDREAHQNCQVTKGDLTRLGQSVAADPEVTRVHQLWDSFCSRYEPVQMAEHRPYPYPEVEPTPLRNNEFAPRDTWPNATE